MVYWSFKGRLSHLWVIQLEMTHIVRNTYISQYRTMHKKPVAKEGLLKMYLLQYFTYFLCKSTRKQSKKIIKTVQE